MHCATTKPILGGTQQSAGDDVPTPASCMAQCAASMAHFGMPMCRTKCVTYQPKRRLTTCTPYCAWCGTNRELTSPSPPTLSILYPSTPHRTPIDQPQPCACIVTQHPNPGMNAARCKGAVCRLLHVAGHLCACVWNAHVQGYTVPAPGDCVPSSKS